ncbi:hypothetical protein FACS1894188_11400 [Clostridia bacterium]|nr:hypothetical protein FACS1894188_11400 [Clostridia bacterium]
MEIQWDGAALFDKEEYENKLREIDRNIFKAEKDITDALEKEQEKRNATFKKLAKERYDGIKKETDNIIKIRQKELDVVVGLFKRVRLCLNCLYLCVGGIFTRLKF